MRAFGRPKPAVWQIDAATPECQIEAPPVGRPDKSMPHQVDDEILRVGGVIV
jgi:hypothetical protein